MAYTSDDQIWVRRQELACGVPGARRVANRVADVASDCSKRSDRRTRLEDAGSRIWSGQADAVRINGHDGPVYYGGARPGSRAPATAAAAEVGSGDRPNRWNTARNFGPRWSGGCRGRRPAAGSPENLCDKGVSPGLGGLLPEKEAAEQGRAWLDFVVGGVGCRTDVVSLPEVAPIGRKSLQKFSVHCCLLLSSSPAATWWPDSGDRKASTGTEQGLDLKSNAGASRRWSMIDRGRLESAEKLAGKVTSSASYCCFLAWPGFRGRFPVTGRLRRGRPRLGLEEACKCFTTVVSAGAWTAEDGRKSRRKRALKPAKNRKIKSTRFSLLPTASLRRPLPHGFSPPRPSSPRVRLY